MDKVIEAVDPSLIEEEFSKGCFLRKSVNAGTEIYCFTAHQAPNAMRELGRLRELTFREAGGGTGQSMDIDEWDTSEDCYTQLVVWDPAERMMLGGYRYKVASPTKKGADLATSHLFHFSEHFVEHMLPYVIELGRSFVQPAYQSTRLRRKGIYALDNLWDGLGGILALNPKTRYFFGKVTMYTSYNVEARNALLYFMQKHCPDPERCVWPRTPLPLNMDKQALDALFVGEDRKKDWEILQRYLADRGERIPPLIKSYMSLSDTMRSFGTVLNAEFGEVEETGILVTVEDIHPEKIERYVGSFKKEKGE